MNFLKGFSQIKQITRIFVPNDAKAPTGVQPKGILYLRYAARLSILFISLFILLWWPAKSFQTNDFNDWSAKMAALPDQVWYLLLSILLSWSVTEIYTARVSKNSNTYQQPPLDTDTSVDYTGTDNLDGRFANLKDNSDFLSGPAEPNPVIEKWKQNETK